jgi:hypothetical protein
MLITQKYCLIWYIQNELLHENVSDLERSPIRLHIPWRQPAA